MPCNKNNQNPDIHLRPFEGDHDFALIASIEQRCLHADRVLRVPTREWIAHTYSGLRNFDPHPRCPHRHAGREASRVCPDELGARTWWPDKPAPSEFYPPATAADGC